MVNLKKFEPKETKFRILKKHGISIGTVANYIGLSYQHVCDMLNGLNRMTPKVKKKHQKLLDQMEEA